MDYAFLCSWYLLINMRRDHATLLTSISRCCKQGGGGELTRRVVMFWRIKTIAFATVRSGTTYRYRFASKRARIKTAAGSRRSCSRHPHIARVPFTFCSFNEWRHNALQWAATNRRGQWVRPGAVYVAFTYYFHLTRQERCRVTAVGTSSTCRGHDWLRCSSQGVQWVACNVTCRWRPDFI